MAPVQGVPSVEDHAFLYNGSMHDLGALGGFISSATAINNLGQVVGLAATTSGVGHAFVYEGSMRDLASSLSNFSQATAVNNLGQAVGSIGPASAAHAALFTGGAVTDLGANGGVSAVANGINDTGWIVGTVYESADQTFPPFNNHTYYAFLYRDGVFLKLGNPGGHSYAAAINGGGWVVGYSSDEPTALNLNSRATLYVDGVSYDLNDLLAPGSLPSGVYLVNATAINDRDQIAANGSDGQAYVLTPVSPASRAHRRER